MIYYMLESDDDFLFTEEASAFMEKASAPVKQSFLSRMVEAVKRLFGKVSEFINRTISKFRGKDMEKKIKNDPKAAKTKVKIKNYNKAVDEGMSTLNKIGKAKSAKEAKKIAEDYKSKRKKILSVAIPTTLLAVATIIGGGLFLKHRKKLEVVSNAIDDAEEIDKKAAQYVKTKGPKLKEVKFNKQTSTTENISKDNHEPKEAKKLGNGGTVDAEADKVEKATITMQVSKMTLDDMMANEKEMVNLINRTAYLSRAYDRQMDIENKVDEQLQRLKERRGQVKKQMRLPSTSESEREELRKKLGMLDSMIERAKKTDRAITRRTNKTESDYNLNFGRLQGKTGMRIGEVSDLITGKIK